MSSGVQPIQGPAPQQLQTPQPLSTIEAQQYAANQYALTQNAAEQQAETAMGNSLSAQGNSADPATAPGGLSAQEGSSKSNPAGAYASGLSGSAAFKFAKLQNTFQNQQLDNQIKTAQLLETRATMDATKQAQFDKHVANAIEDLAPVASMLGLDQDGNLSHKPTPEQLAAAQSYRDKEIQREVGLGVEKGGLTPEMAKSLIQKTSNPDGSISPEKVGALWRTTNAVAAGIKSADAGSKRIKEAADEKKAIIDASTEGAMRNAEISEKQAQARKANQDASGISPEGLALEANLFMKDPTNTRFTAPERKQIMTYLSSQGITSDDIVSGRAQNKAWQSTVRAFDTGKQGDTVRSLNVGVNHLGVLADAATDLNNKDNRTVNRFYNSLAKEFGKADVTNFDVAKQIVGDEVVKAVMGNGAGGVTDRQHLQEAFDAANGPEALAGVVKEAKKLMGGQLEGLRQQYVSAGVAAGQSESTVTGQFNGKLFDGTRKELGDKTASKSGGKKNPSDYPPKNGKGWTIHQDKSGNLAYVSADGKQYEEVK